VAGHAKSVAGTVDTRETILGSGRRRRAASTMAAWTAPSHWRTRPAHEPGGVDPTATLTPCAGPMDSGWLVRSRMHHGGKGRVPVRAIKTSIISILAIGLLAGSAVGVAAQEEAAEFATPLYYTWTAGEAASVVEGAFDESGDELRGQVQKGIPVEASDPRLSGLVTTAINGNAENGTDSTGLLESRSYRVVLDDGAFTGSGTFVVAGDGVAPPAIVREVMVLTGEGAYEGMALFVTGDYREGSSGEAVMFRVAVPPVPDVPAE